MTEDKKNIAKFLAEYVHSFQFQDLDQRVIHEVKRRIIDSIGCAYGALRAPLIPKILGVVPKLPETAKGASIFDPRLRFKTDILSAGFINGVLVRYLDFNDTYLSKEPAHPSDNIPALLALAEARNLSGEDLIAAVALSYEIQCRFCDAASLRVHGWDHVTYIPISVACAASRLLRLTSEQTENAISLAAVSNAALRQTRAGELTEWKGCAAANAARSGLWAALLAQHDVPGPKEIFEGEYGFLKQVIAGDFSSNFYEFLEAKPKPSKILETYIKFYPVEYHIQAVVGAILDLRGRHNIESAENIESITVETYEAGLTICAGHPEKWDPKTRETADHSIPYCLAVALTDGKVWLDQFSDERIRDQKLRPLMEKIHVVENPEFTKLYGSAFPTVIKIGFKNGSVAGARIDFPKGHFQNPMSDEEVIEKFRSLAGENLLKYLMFVKRVDLLRKLWRLEYEGNLGGLFK